MESLQLLLAKLALALISVSFAQTATYAILPPEKPTAAQIFAGNHILERACSCESWGDPNMVPRQFNSDGSLLWGHDPVTGKPIERDLGACQINTEVWASKAIQLGVNLYTLDGNVQFAKYLYDQYGMKPWSASASCWQQKQPN